MKATIALGRYAGIPVGAHWSVLFTVVLLADLLAVGVLPSAAPGLATPAYWVTARAGFSASRSRRLSPSHHRPPESARHPVPPQLSSPTGSSQSTLSH